MGGLRGKGGGGGGHETLCHVQLVVADAVMLYGNHNYYKCN